MILTCPSCGTQYVVKDGAIPPEGRQVRCASCKHSWHQDPESGVEQPPEESQVIEQPVEEQAEPAEEAPIEAGNEDESFTEATLIEPRSGPEAEEWAFEEATAAGLEDGSEPQAPYAEQEQPAEADWREPPTGEVQDDDFTPFPVYADDEPRRRSPLLAILIVVVVVIALAAAFWFLAPDDLKGRLGIATATTPLALVTTHMDRRRLESGNETLTINGRVINPTTKEQSVPPLQAQLKTKAGRVVYSWTIAPPTRSLPAGASASFYSTEVDVPAGGDELTITLGSKAG